MDVFEVFSMWLALICQFTSCKPFGKYHSSFGKRDAIILSLKFVNSWYFRLRGGPVVKLVLLFKHPRDEDAFEEGYVRTLPLLEKMPGILRRQANTVLGGPFGASPYYRILEFYFDSYEIMDAAMTSPQGAAAGRALMEYAGNIVDLIFVDVFEDNTPLN